MQPLLDSDVDFGDDNTLLYDRDPVYDDYDDDYYLITNKIKKTLLDDLMEVEDVFLIEDVREVAKEFNLIGLKTLVGYNIVIPAGPIIGKLLVQRGVSLDVKNEDETLPLHDACAGGFAEIVQLFLNSAGGSQNVSNMLESIDLERDTVSTPYALFKDIKNDDIKNVDFYWDPGGWATQPLRVRGRTLFNPETMMKIKSLVKLLDNNYIF